MVTPHSPHSAAPTGLLPVSVGLRILEILCKWLTCCGAFCIQLSLSCFQGASMIQHISIFCFFLWLKNIPLYGCAALSIHQLMGVVTPCLTIWGTASKGLHCFAFPAMESSSFSTSLSALVIEFLNSHSNQQYLNWELPGWI